MGLEALRLSYQTIPELAAICDELGNRQNNRQMTNIKSFLSKLNQNSIEPILQGKLIAAFRELERLDCGEYVEGRRGYKSRFVWNSDFGSLSICRAAFGEMLSTPQDEDSQDDDTGYNGDNEHMTDLDHQFHLRDTYQVEISLPVNLTVAEAKRLAMFIKSLPLDDFQ